MSTLYWSLREAIETTVSVLGSVSTFVRLLELTWCSLLQETKPTALTKFDEKGYLCEIYFHKQCLSLIGGIKEFEIMVAEFVSAVSSSTHFGVSDRCRWKWCATNIIAYLFEYNNNKNTFLSPYNALALKIDLSSTIITMLCLNVNFVLVPKGHNRNNTCFV